MSRLGFESASHRIERTLEPHSPGVRASAKLQSLLDRLPRLRVTILGRRIPSWHAWGAAGLALGTLLFLLLTVQAAGDAGTAALLVGAGCLSIWGVRLVSRQVFGYPRGVLLEHFVPALVLNLLIFTLLGLPSGIILDRWIIGVTVFLAIGRIGCLLTGCCHGKVSAWGIHYPWMAPHTAPPTRERVHFLPVQAFESLLCGLLLMSELILYISPHQPGDILGLFLAGYAAGRFGLEYLRGDQRPYRLGFSEAQWTSCGLIASMAITLLAIPSFRTTYYFSLLSGAFGLVAIFFFLASRASSKRDYFESRS